MMGANQFSANKRHSEKPDLGGGFGNQFSANRRNTG